MAAQEVGGGGFVLVGVDAQEHPARGPVNGHKQVALGLLVGHLRQVLDVHMDEVRYVVLERLGRSSGIATGQFDPQIAQAAYLRHGVAGSDPGPSATPPG